MAADNVTLNSGSGGSTVRTLSDGTNEWQAVVPAYVTGGGAGAWTLQTVDSGHGLPVVLENASVAVTGTFWQATQPVSGTVTANVGTTNGLALDGSVNGLLVSQGSTTSGEKGPLAQGAVTAAAPAYTTGQTSPLSLTTAGALRVDGSGVTQPVSGTFWQATQPVSGTITANQGGAPWAENVTQLAGNGIATGNGATNAGTLRVTISSDSTGQVVLAAGSATIGSLAANQSVNVAQVGGAAAATGHGTAAGSLRVELPTDGTGQVNALQSGTWTVQPGNAANTTPWLTADQAATAGGTSVYSFLSAAAVQSAAVKASAGQVYALHFFNNTGTIAYVRLYNQTTAPAAGDTANIVYRGLIPANTSGAGFVVPIPPGTVFGTGIGLRVTAGVADNDATALAANGVLGNVFYK